jgi:hypothetical protein
LDEENQYFVRALLDISASFAEAFRVEEYGVAKEVIILCAPLQSSHASTHGSH